MAKEYDSDSSKNKPPSAVFKLKGHVVREDVNGLLCLSDIYRAAGSPKHQAPNDWTGSRTARDLQIAVVEKNPEKFRVKGKISYSAVLYKKQGRDGGTYAHPVIAAAYAGYLNPKLGYEIHETWLRARAGDPTLADEILQRASTEGNQWAAIRAMGRVTRRDLTDTWQAHGVDRKGYPRCTNAVYRGAFGRTCVQLKADKGLVQKDNLRDGMSINELAATMLAEGMAAERIREEHSRGNVECERATLKAAGFVKMALDAEKASRKPKML